MATVYYQGHGSLRFTTDAGKVIYLDPYAGDGYDLPADLVLITHEHGDHNQLGLVTQKPDCAVITEREALVNGVYQHFVAAGVGIRAVEAFNQNHNRKECVGYILELDGKKVYCAGDTSTTQEMERMMDMNLDYAFLPTDGIYNMDLQEAARCGTIIRAKHTVPIHIKPGALFDRQRAEQFDCPTRLILEPGETREL